jgi:hypothetical protein
VIELSSPSDEEDFIPDTSRDFEFAQRLYGELNRSHLALLDDGKIIILSDSDEEKEEVHEEKSTGVEAAATSVAVNPASTASTDDAPEGAKNDNSEMIRGPIKRLVVGTATEMTLMRLRLPRQERCLRQACFKESYAQHCYPTSSFV